MSDESRAYPSPLYFEDRLRIEVEKALSAVKSLDDALAQLRVIWAVKHRDAVLSFIENIRPKYAQYWPEDVQPQIAAALTDLVDASNGLKAGQRHNADQAVSRLIKHLSPERQMEIIWPWMQDTRPFRVSIVIRTIHAQANANPYADYLVNHFRESRPSLLGIIARTPEAAKQIAPDELSRYFEWYKENFRPDPMSELQSSLLFQAEGPDKSSKYFAMIAAKILIVGGNPIPAELLRTIPEIFSWAIDQLADPAHEAMLVFLIVENNQSPELLWSTIRTAQRLNMQTALERGLQAARELLNMPEPEPVQVRTYPVQQRLPGD